MKPAQLLKQIQSSQVVLANVCELMPYPDNPLTHPDYQVKKLADAMMEFGFTNPILIDQNGEIIAGHGRCLAAIHLGLEVVPCIVLKHLNPDQKRAYVIADNKLAELAEWDMETLEREVRVLKSEDYNLNLTGLDQFEIAKMVDNAKDTGSDYVAPDVEFSEFLDESNNYVVLKFNNDMDWLAAQTHFGLKTVSSKRGNGKEWSKGIGRVVDGAGYINKIKEAKL